MTPFAAARASARRFFVGCHARRESAKPGMRMDCAASSWRSALVSDQAVDLLAAYAASSPPLIHDATDSPFSRAPPPLARSTGANALLMFGMPKRLVSKIWRVTAPCRSCVQLLLPASLFPLMRCFIEKHQ
jgi:hypothetical protein